jgi:signal transduction histidine kinase
MEPRSEDDRAGVPDLRDLFTQAAAQIELDYGAKGHKKARNSSEADACGWSAGSNYPEFTRAEVIDEVLRARDDERQRISQELHDSAGQLLVSLQLSVHRLGTGGQGDSPVHDALVEEIHATVMQIDREIRALAFLTYPVEIRDRSLPEALEFLGRGFAKRTGFRLEFKTVGDANRTHEEVSIALLRVAQEALTNVYRHAQASSVGMSLKANDRIVGLTISDNGIGLPSGQDWTAVQGVGVSGMRHRIEQLGGKFRIRKSRTGTILSASVPVAA